MKLLVIGASGHCGHWVTRLASEQGHQVTAFDTKLRTAAGVPMRAHSLVHGVTLAESPASATTRLM